MEKFGIFELLDALSALTAQDGANTERTESTPPSPTESAFTPPAYGASPEQAAPAKAAATQNDAFGAFLSRHDSISKRIDGDNKKR